jgi:hypothetical protein
VAVVEVAERSGNLAEAFRFALGIHLVAGIG